MVLASPAVFEHGWRPGWLNEDKSRVGCAPGSSVKLRLVSLISQRWRAVSGWSYEPVMDKGDAKQGARPGPKPIRRLMPAGGVYFFELEPGSSAADLANSWLEPVSDRAADRADGFGLALWGVW
jgi:CRISPR-associated protein Cmr3